MGSTAQVPGSLPRPPWADAHVEGQLGHSAKLPSCARSRCMWGVEFTQSQVRL